MNTSKSLLAILVEELPKRGGWPKGAVKIHQDYDREAWAWQSDEYEGIESLGYLDSLCSNHRPKSGDETSEMFVTRDQYEAALAASKRCDHKWIASEGRTKSGYLCSKCGNYDGPGYDWIDWHGGKCPVPEGTLISVKHRDGCLYEYTTALGSKNRCWSHDNHPGDIVAYRLHQPQDANSRANDDRLAQDVKAISTDSESDLNECIGQAVPEWDGRGLPPVGAEFNYGSHRSRAKCLAVGHHFVFASKGNPDDEDGDYEELLIDAQTEFYQVDEVRDSLVREIMASARTPAHTAVLIANKLLAAGYRKQ